MAYMQDDGRPVHQDIAQSANLFLGASAQTAVAISDLSTYVDAITSDVSWSAVRGQSATVTYSFSLQSIDTSTVYADNYWAFNASQQNAAMNAMNTIARFANITFERALSPSSADIQFYNGDLGSGVLGITGYYYTVGGVLSYAAIGMDDGSQNFNLTGTSAYQTLLHEIGHAVGLKHSGNYGAGEEGPFLPAHLDNANLTVMSYYDGDGNKSSFQDLDIAALQYLYGVASGSSSYITASPVLNSYVNESLTATSASIMRGGLGVDTLNGSSGSDTIYGGRSQVDQDDQSDVLFGYGGSDFLYGNSGNDTVYGGDGGDVIFGGKNSDVLYGEAGADSLSGGGNRFDPFDNADTLYGGAGNDSLLGNGGADAIYGGDGNDTIYGGFGGDQIHGEGGDDFIVGQHDNETLIGGAGRDIFYFQGQDGTDFIQDFTAGEDIIRVIANANGSGIASAADVLARMSASGFNTLLDLGGGHVVTIAEALSDISASDIQVL